MSPEFSRAMAQPALWIFFAQGLITTAAMKLEAKKALA
jgi:hypothetical protein